MNDRDEILVKLIIKMSEELSTVNGILKSFGDRNKVLPQLKAANNNLIEALRIPNNE